METRGCVYLHGDVLQWTWFNKFDCSAMSFIWLMLQYNIGLLKFNKTEIILLPPHLVWRISRVLFCFPEGLSWLQWNYFSSNGISIHFRYILFFHAILTVVSFLFLMHIHLKDLQFRHSVLISFLQH